MACLAFTAGSSPPWQKKPEKQHLVTTPFQRELKKNAVSCQNIMVTGWSAIYTFGFHPRLQALCWGITELQKIKIIYWHSTLEKVTTVPINDDAICVCAAACRCWSVRTGVCLYWIGLSHWQPERRNGRIIGVLSKMWFVFGHKLRWTTFFVLKS